ncbi:ComEC/Rec2 family competence protein [Lentibacillus juripiscarius]|uniref:ComEC/Rec2 family competence protein n=1 Tax=Lentibacillus juripiscarius TaxID=257446 RepID=A0ABW5V2C7_9BACI
MHRHTIIFTLTIIFTSILTPSAHIHAEQQSDLDVHFINVGQGDSMLIQTPSGKNILIDGGRPKAGKKVVKFLKEQNVNKIDLMIATHPDIDHIGGLIQVMKTFEVKRILDTGKMNSTRTYARYVSQIIKQQIPIDIAERNDLIKLDPKLKVRILNTNKGTKSTNKSSIVMKVTFKELDFLLMSDVEKEQEKKLMKKYSLDSEIMKVAHHGSHTSTSLEFLKEVIPEAAILTYGKNNKFGHPVDRVMENLRKVDTAIYPTATFGDITVRTDGDGYVIINEKSPVSSLEVG